MHHSFRTNASQFSTNASQFSINASQFSIFSCIPMDYLPGSNNRPPKQVANCPVGWSSSTLKSVCLTTLVSFFPVLCPTYLPSIIEVYFAFGWVRNKPDIEQVNSQLLRNLNLWWPHRPILRLWRRHPPLLSGLTSWGFACFENWWLQSIGSNN